ncbi:Histone acetyltransferase (MysT1) [Penicillium paradoxum]|uniref:Histone acetyltransferase (MysT1) n=1 Tax=Penicillium paradoxum TaxID=176176 RepID=UPI0025471F87|nr:Histone acetyltransferase (MysT1) [Penicillium paradoxum]KAJ5773586.1 Histone acetyltransferase (MysT1) [Penicillium paradoxum]
MATPKSAQLQAPAARNVNNVVLGDLLFKPWNQSIYPEELVAKDADRLYVCRWCFRYSCDGDVFEEHKRACEHRTTPPGTKVYDYGGYAVWEVDGENHKLFGQNLSLFAKLFLDHKTVFFDVATFLYYILTFTDPNEPGSYYVLGFFSKEKLSWDANNLACILIFPPYQHKQLGKLLMGVSYKLSGWDSHNGCIGGPEKPLSELGHKSYVRFWAERIARFLLRGKPGDDSKPTPKGSRKRPSQETMTVEEIGLGTGMLTEDVITALKSMGLFEQASPKKRKSNRIAMEDNITPPGQMVTICKSDVWEWAKAHHLSFVDPVSEEGFEGLWPPIIVSQENGQSTTEED